MTLSLEDFDGPEASADRRKNRLDPLGEQAGPRALSLDFGKRLKRAQEFPPAPEGLPREKWFGAARERVGEAWRTGHKDSEGNPIESVFEEIAQQGAAWAESVEVSDPELANQLRDSAALNRAIENGFMGPYEALRSALPEAWMALMHIVSLRQLSEVAVVRRWLPKNSDNPEHNAMSIMVDLASTLGKYVDTAYLRQMELAEKPGGSDAGPLASVRGAQHIYDFMSNEASAVTKSVAEVFPFEFQRMEKGLLRLAQRIDAQVLSEKLSTSFAPLSKVLRQLAAKISSKTSDPQLALEEWTALETTLANLNVECDCPITLNWGAVPSVAGDANKVDIELRLGWIGEKERALNTEFMGIQEAAQRLKARILPDSDPVPPSTSSQLVWGFGPNLHFRAAAESNAHRITMHPNLIGEEAKDDFNVMKRLAPELMDSISEEEFTHASLLLLNAHESSHAFDDRDSERMHARFAKDAEVMWVFEEIKAETGSAAIALEAGELMNARVTPLAKLGLLINLVLGSAPEGMGLRYHLSGLLPLHRLFQKGVIQLNAGSIQVPNLEQILPVLTEQWTEVRRNIYDGELPELGTMLEAQWQAARDDAAFQVFLSAIRTSSPSAPGNEA